MSENVCHKQKMSMYRQLWARLVRFGFHLLYHQMAWTYDTVSWLVSMGAWRDWQHAALPFLLGPRVLEIAHGPGHMLLALNKAGFFVVGIDLSPQMGHLAFKRLQRAGQPAHLLRGSAQILPFSATTFDSALITFPTGFVTEQETLSALFRVLKTNGHLVIVPEAQLTGTSILERTIEWLYVITGQRRQTFFAPKRQQPFPHGHQGSLQQQLLTAGFHVDVNRITLARSSVTVILAQKP
jgi:ubiquinone/menaquinone biosynthesis C-methylase UbiE